MDEEQEQEHCRHKEEEDDKGKTNIRKETTKMMTITTMTKERAAEH